MSEVDDVPAGKPFPDPKLPNGSVGDYVIVEGKRAFHAASPYPFPELKPYFEIDAYKVRHRNDTVPRRLEVFERGNSVGVLLYNRDATPPGVIVVEQFRLPTVGQTAENGMIIETVAGEAKNGATAVDVAIRRTLEETGYAIQKPELIAEFFSSPGGTSERITLFFAEVGNADKVAKPSSEQTGERIKVVNLTIDELTRKLRNHEILDPKLLIAAYHLQARLGLRFDTDDPDDNGTADEFYVRLKEPRVSIGIKTGDILSVRDVDIWLNPENRYMMMSRIIDKGLSASIRWGGAEKYRSLAVATDTIGNALRVAMGGRAEANEIIETVPGALQKFGVKRLLHLPIAEADGDVKARAGLSVNRARIKPVLLDALRHAHDGEHGANRLMSILKGRTRCTSVLIPLIGSGEGGVTPHHCVPEILKGIEEFLGEHPETCLKEFWLLAHWKREVEICKSELQKFAKDFAWSERARPLKPA